MKKRAGSSRSLLLAAAGLAVLSAEGQAGAFPLVVRKGDTLAGIAERVYGRVEMEQLLVAANALDAGGGIPLLPGMRLEIPAAAHRRVAAGETWASLAFELLGDAERSDVLALANDSYPWLTPADGQEILVPYNLTYVARQGDSTLTIAYRFLGERDKAWQLDRYNRLKGKPLKRGDVVLVPVVELPLTAEGKALAAEAGALVRSEGAGRAREAQKRAEAEMPQLAADVRQGRYVDAITRGNKVLGFGELEMPQLAEVYRLLTESYVAMDARGLAETACRAWREADPGAALDPIEVSPKILRACTQATEVTNAMALPPPAPPAPPAPPGDAGAESAADAGARGSP